MIDNVRAGQNIAAFRQRLGWTQGELASRLNVTHQAVSKWENGVAFPDISTLYALSQLFGVSMEILLTGEAAAPEAPEKTLVEPEAPVCEKPPAPKEAAVQKSLHYSWDEIIALAPFASRDTLDRLVSECESSCDRDHIFALAPFLGRSTLDRLILSSSDKADWDEIIALAPFASRDTLDRLVSECESSCDRDHIFALAPFLGRSTLDRLILSSSDKANWDEIIALAPFASRDTLDRLVSECESSCDRDHIFALAPFLGRDTIDRLILGGNQTKAPDKSTDWENELSSWSEAHEKEADELAAWSEAHEKEADELAAWSEAHEKEFEQEARRAERIAARTERRMLRQAEKIAAKLADKAEQIHTAASENAANTLKAFSPLLEKHLGHETVNQLIECRERLDDVRRTQIIDAVPACPSLDAYADRVASLLYEALDPAAPAASRIEEVRQALLNQDFSALNEFASLLDTHIGHEWLEEYASLCPEAEIPPDFNHQIDLALAQCNWNWIEDHAHLITDPEIIRRIVLASTSEGFFDFVPLFADQLDQHSLNEAARLAVRMGCTDDILPVSGRVSPGILD